MLLIFYLAAFCAICNSNWSVIPNNPNKNKWRELLH